MNVNISQIGTTGINIKLHFNTQISKSDWKCKYLNAVQYFHFPIYSNHKILDSFCIRLLSRVHYKVKDRLLNCFYARYIFERMTKQYFAFKRYHLIISEYKRNVLYCSWIHFTKSFKMKVTKYSLLVVLLTSAYGFSPMWAIEIISNPIFS